MCMYIHTQTSYIYIYIYIYNIFVCIYTHTHSEGGLMPQYFLQANPKQMNPVLIPHTHTPYIPTHTHTYPTYTHTHIHTNIHAGVCVTETQLWNVIVTEVTIKSVLD